MAKVARNQIIRINKAPAAAVVDAIQFDNDGQSNPNQVANDVTGASFDIPANSLDIRQDSVLKLINSGDPTGNDRIEVLPVDLDVVDMNDQTIPSSGNPELVWKDANGDPRGIFYTAASALKNSFGNSPAFYDDNPVNGTVYRFENRVSSNGEGVPDVQLRATAASGNQARRGYNDTLSRGYVDLTSGLPARGFSTNGYYGTSHPQYRLGLWDGAAFQDFNHQNTGIVQNRIKLQSSSDVATNIIALVFGFGTVRSSPSTDAYYFDIIIKRPANSGVDGVVERRGGTVLGTIPNFFDGNMKELVFNLSADTGVYGLSSLECTGLAAPITWNLSYPNITQRFSISGGANTDTDKFKTKLYTYSMQFHKPAPGSTEETSMIATHTALAGA